MSAMCRYRSDCAKISRKRKWPHLLRGVAKGELGVIQSGASRTEIMSGNVRNLITLQMVNKSLRLPKILQDDVKCPFIASVA
jgi:hypothetical protein